MSIPKFQIESFSDLHKQIGEIILPADIRESYDLQRIKKLLGQLNNPQNKLRVVHVAGTSGKTSTSYYIAEMLQRNSYKVGLSISPHIEEINERVQVNLKPLDEEMFCQNFSEYVQLLQKLDAKVTYFELFVSFAFWYFAKIKVDWAVFEVGLGGLLDATNVINSPDKICVLTDIGLDHMSVLGDSIDEVAAQKAGIIGKNNKVFCIDQKEEVMRIVWETCKSQNAELKVVFVPKEPVSLPYFQQRNWNLAKTVSEFVYENDSKSKLNPQELVKTTKVIIPGRIEKFNIMGKTIILDGAHNPQKINALIKSLGSELTDKKPTIILSIGNNKKSQLLEITQSIEKISDRIIVTSFDESQDFQKKSLDPQYLAEYFPDSDVEVTHDVNSAIDNALKQKNNLIVITGSLYLTSKARAKLLKLRD